MSADSIPVRHPFCVTLTATKPAEREDLLSCLDYLIGRFPECSAVYDEDVQVVYSPHIHWLRGIVGRIRDGYRLSVEAGEITTAYVEVVKGAAFGIGRVEKSRGRETQVSTCTVQVEPIFSPSLEIRNLCDSDGFPAEFANQFHGFTRKLFQKGPLGYPVLGLSASLTDVTLNPDCTVDVFRELVSRGIESALETAGTKVWEPLIKLELTAPAPSVKTLLATLNRINCLLEDVKVTPEGEITLCTLMPAEYLVYLEEPLLTVTGGDAGKVRVIPNVYVPKYRKPVYSTT